MRLLLQRPGIRGQATGLAIGDAKSYSGMGPLLAYRGLGSGFVGSNNEAPVQSLGIFPEKPSRR